MIFSTEKVIESYTDKSIKEENEEIYSDFFFKSLDMALESRSELLYELDDLDLSHGIVDNIYSQKIKLFNPREVMDDVINRLKSNCENLLDNFTIQCKEIEDKYGYDKFDKDKIEKFKGKVNYDTDYYIFSNLSSNTTYLSNISRLLISNYERLEDFIKLLKSDREDEVINNLNNIVLDKDVNRMTSIRGFLIGKDHIEESDYADELFNFFRKEKLKPGELSDERVSSAIKNVYYENNSIAVIKRENDKFFDLIQDIVNHIESFNIGDRLKSDEAVLLYNNIITDYCKELDEICNIYLLYIASKMDAYREFYDTNVHILSLI